MTAWSLQPIDISRGFVLSLVMLFQNLHWSSRQHGVRSLCKWNAAQSDWDKVIDSARQRYFTSSPWQALVALGLHLVNDEMSSIKVWHIWLNLTTHPLYLCVHPVASFSSSVPVPQVGKHAQTLTEPCWTDEVVFWVMSWVGSTLMSRFHSVHFIEHCSRTSFFLYVCFCELQPAFCFWVFFW